MGGSARQTPERDEASDINNKGFADKSASGSSTGGTGENKTSSQADIREDASRVREKITEGAASTARDLKARAASFADEQKQYGAERLEGVAGVVDKAAGDLEKELPEAAGFVREAARGLNDFSRSIRDRSTGDIIQSVNDFARREPAAFFGTAVLAGFALSRFMKSTADRPVEARSSSYDNNSGQGSYGSGQGSYGSSSEARGSRAQHDVARPDGRGSWPEMEEGDMGSSRGNTTWDRPSDSPSLADDETKLTHDSSNVSATEPGMGFSTSTANKQ
jgi:hypothetical protein